jgi:hypothetical protein
MYSENYYNDPAVTAVLDEIAAKAEARDEIPFRNRNEKSSAAPPVALHVAAGIKSFARAYKIIHGREPGNRWNEAMVQQFFTLE